MTNVKLLPTNLLTDVDSIARQLEAKYPIQITTSQKELHDTFKKLYQPNVLPQLASHQIVKDFYGNKKYVTATNKTITVSKYDYLKKSNKYKKKSAINKTLDKVSYYQAYHQERLILLIDTADLLTDTTDSGTNKLIQYGEVTNPTSKLSNTEYNIVTTHIKDLQRKQITKILDQITILGTELNKAEANPKLKTDNKYVNTIKSLIDKLISLMSPKGADRKTTLEQQRKLVKLDKLRELYKHYKHRQDQLGPVQYTKLIKLTLVDIRTLNTYPIQTHHTINDLLSEITTNTLDSLVNRDALVRVDKLVEDTEDLDQILQLLDIDAPVHHIVVTHTSSGHKKDGGGNKLYKYTYTNHYSRYYKSEEDIDTLRQTLNYYLDNDIIPQDQYQEAYRTTVLRRLANDQDFELESIPYLYKEFHKLPDVIDAYHQARPILPKPVNAAPKIDRSKYEALLDKPAVKHTKRSAKYVSTFNTKSVSVVTSNNVDISVVAPSLGTKVVPTFNGKEYVSRISYTPEQIAKAQAELDARKQL